MEKYIKILRLLKSNDSGNIMIMVAVFILVIFAIGGAGVDFGRAQLIKMKAQQASDAAALAAANPAGASPTGQDREKAANLYYNLNFPANYLGVERPELNYTADNYDNPLNVAVDGSAKIDTNFIRTMAHKNLNISAGTKANVGIRNPQYDAILVLDVSDSMDWKFDGSKCDTNGASPCNNNDGLEPTTGNYCFAFSSEDYYSCRNNSRLYALKTAAMNMTAILLAEAVKENNRMAAVTWNRTVQKTQNFTNDRGKMINFLDPLKARYETDSTTGLTKALDMAGDFRSNAIHAVVLLTDGENNGGGLTHDQAIDDASVAICQQFKNMSPPTIVYTIALGDSVEQDALGNFLKPEGQNIDRFLRRCASGDFETNKDKYYFISHTGTDLNDIFITIAKNLQKLRITE